VPDICRGVLQHGEVFAGLDLDHLELGVDKGEAARSVLALRLKGPAGVGCGQRGVRKNAPANTNSKDKITLNNTDREDYKR